MADRFFIGPYNTGLLRDRKPFLIPDEAFSTLENAYVWRNRVRKRFGARVMNGSVMPDVQQLFTRFRINIGTTDAGGNFVGSVPTSAPNTPIATPAIGQNFSVATTIFTVNMLGVPAPMLSTGSATGTYNTTTGAVTINGAAALTPVYFFPALPVMGLLSLETGDVNEELIIGFDTRFAYNFNNGTSWERYTGVNWTGNDLDFFWADNWRGTLASDRLFFVTNFKQTVPYDPMYYFDGVSIWTPFQPIYNPNNNDAVLTAQIIIAFQGRLVFLNTIEQVNGTASQFKQRARFSQNGNPIQSDAFYSAPYVFGKGDSIDAPTSEAIVTGLILKDRLIVYFERSTWELVYTGNQVVPFVWQTINIELGAESTQSVIPFDTVILAVGDVGIHSCNGGNTARIDDKIPDQIFQVRNDNGGPERIAGVRDYNSEMVYWSYPDENSVGTTIYPSKVLTYNYKAASWGINDDSITAFGQYQFSTSLTWSNTEFKWDDADFTWTQGFNLNFSRNVIAGNQEGFTFIIDRDTPVNSHAISITDITGSAFIGTIVAVNHNLNDGDYIFIDFVTSKTDPNGTITNLNGSIFQVLVDDANSFQIELNINFDPGAVYSGGGTFRRVSVINILTKQYNFYLDRGFSFTTNKIDFLVDRQQADQTGLDVVGVTVQVLPTSSNFVSDSSILQTCPYNPTFAPMESQQDMLWHTIYPNSFGSFLQFAITLTDAQLRTPVIADADFRLNAMVVHTIPTSTRLQ